MEWLITKDTDYLKYMQQFQVNSLLAKILAYKKLDEAIVNNFLSERIVYHDFSLFLEAEMTLERIQEAIDSDEKICIYGDYDCDGILATTILVQAFKQLGKTVGYHIPSRLEDGYGLNVSRVEQIASKGYTLIITVDNGVKAFDAVEKANELGVDVIITDHHGFEVDLPDACSIIHTKLSPDYPFKEISGGFVAYKLASALLGKHDKYLYCLAAITTVSDMMPLMDENRSLVKRALNFMKEEKYLPLELLLGDNQTYNMQSLGFIIAPKINSFGRLSEMVNPNNVVKFFLNDNSIEFMNSIAANAIKINGKRQELTSKQYQEVLKNTNPNEKFLFSHEVEIHEGIVGLVAGKYTRQFNRPSFVMCYDSNSDVYKGSARGIEGLALNDIFSDVKDLLVTYGGHSLAGGFSVTKDNLKILKTNIGKYIDNKFESMPDVKIDALKIEEEDVTKENIKSLSMLEPFGNGNDDVLFYLEDVLVEKVYTLSEGKHLKFDLDLKNTKIQALYFNSGKLIEQFNDQKTIRVVGKLNINNFRNIESINMIIEDIK